MQPRILARRQVQTGFALALLHHPVSADVQITGIGIAGNHAIRSARIASAIERPVHRDRELVEIDIVAQQSILEHGRFRW